MFNFKKLALVLGATMLSANLVQAEGPSGHAAISRSEAVVTEKMSFGQKVRKAALVPVKFARKHWKTILAAAGVAAAVAFGVKARRDHNFDAIKGFLSELMS